MKIRWYVQCTVLASYIKQTTMYPELIEKMYPFFLNWKHSEGSPHCKILLKAVKEQVTKDTYRGELGCIKKEKERSGTELAESPMYKESKEKC